MFKGIKSIPILKHFKFRIVVRKLNTFPTSHHLKYHKQAFCPAVRPSKDRKFPLSRRTSVEVEVEKLVSLTLILWVSIWKTTKNLIKKE